VEVEGVEVESLSVVRSSTQAVSSSSSNSSEQQAGRQAGGPRVRKRTSHAAAHIEAHPTPALHCAPQHNTTQHKPHRLQKRTKWRWLYSIATAVRWGLSIAGALAALHAADPAYVHGDVKVCCVCWARLLCMLCVLGSCAVGCVLSAVVCWWLCHLRLAAGRGSGAAVQHRTLHSQSVMHSALTHTPCAHHHTAPATTPPQAINVFLTDTITVDGSTVKLGDLKPHRCAAWCGLWCGAV